MRRQRRSGTAALLAVLIALVLAVPFGSSGRADDPAGPGGAGAPGVENGLPTRATALGLPAKAPVFAGRQTTAPVTAVPWALDASRGFDHRQRARTAPTARAADAAGAPSIRSWWGRAPPQTSV